MILKNICTGLSILLFLAASGCAVYTTPRDGHFSLPFWGIAVDGYPLTGERLRKIEKETGLPSHLVVFFLQWPALTDKGVANFPEETLDAIWNTGAIPCLTWEPMYYVNGQENMVPYETIVSGSYDSYILEFARRARLWEGPFMIRFAHEMNIDRYHWGTEKTSYGPESPEIYKQMFRHVASLFRKAGAKNVLWVFCPNAESVPNVSHDPRALWNRVANYYPGDEYADILGIDGYNWGTSQTKEKHGWNSRWQSFEEIFKSVYGELRTLAPHKPVIIFETASVTQGGDKTLWIKEAFETLKKWQIRGIVWFHVLKDADWRIQSGINSDYAKIIRRDIFTSEEWLRGYVK
ncbi:MAG: glycosyl hydrolase [Desulfobacterales bacterium]|nr:glycosyl hydrolase [Desulfobacterales bacterium]